MLRDFTQRLCPFVCSSGVVCCQNKLAELCRCPFSLGSAHPLKMKIPSVGLGFEMPSGSCVSGQTMCVILNSSSRQFHIPYSSVPFRHYV